jgi:hypothetical protein
MHNAQRNAHRAAKHNGQGDVRAGLETKTKSPEDQSYRAAFLLDANSAFELSITARLSGK